VLLRPLHLRLTKRLGNRPRAAALTTTLVMFLCVLLPTAVVGGMAATEAATIVQSLDRQSLAEKLSALQNRLSLGPPPDAVMSAMTRMQQTLDELEDAPDRAPPPDVFSLQMQLAVDSALIEKNLNLAAPPHVVATGGLATPDDAANEAPPPAVAPEVAAGAASPKQLVDDWQRWRTLLAEPKPEPADADAWEAAWAEARAALLQFQSNLLGGPIAAWIKKHVHVEPEQLDGLISRARSAAGPAALGTTQFLLGSLLQFSIGLVVMLVGLYYFLADGSEMTDALMRLIPLDRPYLEQLAVEFGNLSRAVVLSMLLAAGAQGVLAGIGYWLCGLESVFLLTLVTTLFAMVPLVGATAVWGSCAVWLYLDGNTFAAVGLAIYGTLVVSLADNLIKPIILHGSSNLHPLVALLSVLGGVEALGPIGVFVGPMVVALLHTLLVMLQKELHRFDAKPLELPPR